MKKFIIAFIVLVAIILLGIKLYYSEQLRLAWNRPRYLHDGRHFLTGDEASAKLQVRGDFRIAAEKDGTNRWDKAVRIVPGGGVELSGEESLSFVSSRKGKRQMLKLRPMEEIEAKKDAAAYPAEKEGETKLYFERRAYEGDQLLAMSKEFALGKGGLYFFGPGLTGDATVFVPDPTEENFGDTSNLGKAAANRDFVLGSRGSLKFQKAPENMHSPGKEGDLAADDEYLYIYRGGRWLRVPLETW